MNPAEFKDSPSGTLIPTIAGRMAFVPNPLPPTIDYAALAIPLAETMQAIGELNGAGRSLTDPMLVIRPLQRREALLSSAMEGTYTTANQLALAEVDDDLATDAATLEVRNYIRAFDVANDMRQEMPICNRMIKSIHAALLSQTATGRGASKRPGAFKDQQNFISGGDRRIEAARFVPPPSNETETAMAALERFINREGNPIPPIIESALIHYQFETIHPFADGNGRVGRIMIPIHLMQAKVLDKPLLYVSPSVEGRKSTYVDLMLGVSKSGNWTDWIDFFLNITKSSCESALTTLSSLEKLRGRYRNLITTSGGTARDVAAAESLFARPVVTIPMLAQLLGVTYPTAQNTVSKLVNLGILHELPGHSNPRIFVCCWRITDISEGRQEEEFPNVDVEN